MDIELKKWVGLGLTTTLLGTALIACSNNDGEGGEAATHHPDSHVMTTDTGEGEGEVGEGGEGGEGGETGHHMGDMSVENRLAFMTGHVKAGLALYRAGEAEMAAPHLLHPVSETHEAEREGLDKLGFKASLFETVSEALESGRPASEIEPQLKAAEKNLSEVATRAGGNPVSIIKFLMDTIDEEYAIAITDGKVSDPGEYQDAFGFAHVAKEQAMKLEPPYQAAVNEQINELIALWKDGPLPSETPAAVGKVLAKTSAVKLALPH